jgi:cyanophycin synthetase
VFAVGDAYVVVDYGHNPQAIRALCETTLRWPRTRLTAVLGVPGDRSNDLIRECGRAVDGVDRVIIREDDDTRGRQRGEVAAMLREGVRDVSPSMPVSVVLNELESIDTAVAQLLPGEIAVAFVDDVAAVIEALSRLGAVPANVIDVLRPVGAAVTPSAA